MAMEMVVVLTRCFQGFGLLLSAYRYLRHVFVY